MQINLKGRVDGLSLYEALLDAESQMPQGFQNFANAEIRLQAFDFNGLRLPDDSLPASIKQYVQGHLRQIPLVSPIGSAMVEAIHRCLADEAQIREAALMLASAPQGTRTVDKRIDRWIAALQRSQNTSERIRGLLGELDNLCQLQSRATDCAKELALQYSLRQAFLLGVLTPAALARENAVLREEVAHLQGLLDSRASDEASYLPLDLADGPPKDTAYDDVPDLFGDSGTPSSSVEALTQQLRAAEEQWGAALRRLRTVQLTSRKAEQEISALRDKLLEQQKIIEALHEKAAHAEDQWNRALLKLHTAEQRRMEAEARTAYWESVLPKRIDAPEPSDVLRAATNSMVLLRDRVSSFAADARRQESKDQLTQCAVRRLEYKLAQARQTAKGARKAGARDALRLLLHLSQQRAGGTQLSALAAALCEWTAEPLRQLRDTPSSVRLPKWVWEALRSHEMELELALEPHSDA